MIIYIWLGQCFVRFGSITSLIDNCFANTGQNLSGSTICTHSSDIWSCTHSSNSFQWWGWIWKRNTKIAGKYFTASNQMNINVPCLWRCVFQEVIKPLIDTTQSSTIFDRIKKHLMVFKPQVSHYYHKTKEYNNMAITVLSCGVPICNNWNCGDDEADLEASTINPWTT